MKSQPSADSVRKYERAPNRTSLFVLSFVSFATLLAVVVFWLNPVVKYADATYRMMAESIDQDHGFRVWELPEYADWLDNYMTPAGYLPIHHTIGRSLITLPFYSLFRFLAHRVEAVGASPFDFASGSLYYRAVFNLPGLIAAFLAAVVVFHACLKLFGFIPALLGTGLAITSSYFFLLLFVHHSWADGPLMLIIALMVQQALNLDRGASRGQSPWFLLGLLSGLACLFRLQGFICLGIPFSSFATSGRKGKPEVISKRILLIVGGLVLGLLPVLAYQHYYVGTWALNYSFGTTGQKWFELLRVILSLAGPLFESPVFIIGILAIPFLARKAPGVALGGGLMVLGSFLLMSLYRGWEDQGWGGGRFPMLLPPFVALGLSQIMSRLHRIWRIAGTAAGIFVNLLGPVSRYMGECNLVFSPMHWSSRGFAKEASPAFVSPAVLARQLPLFVRNLEYLLFTPKFSGSFFIALPIAILGTILAVLFLRCRDGKRGWTGWIPGWIALLFAVYSLLVVILVGTAGQRWITRQEQAGFYDNKWRTMIFEVWDEAGLAHERCRLYLSLDDFPGAKRQFQATMINWSGNTTRVAFRELNEFKNKRAIASHPFEGMTRAPNAIAEERVDDLETQPEIQRAFDGSVTTGASFHAIPENKLFFRMDSDRCSDLYIIFDSPASAAAARVELQKATETTEIFRDVPPYPVPSMIQFDDTLWIRDIFHRGYRRGSVSWTALPQDARIMEIFGVMNQRHLVSSR